MKSNPIAIATLGICPTESRALVAATRVLEGRLPALIDWFDAPEQAEVVVRNLDIEPSQTPALGESTVIVPYRTAGDVPETGIARPLRMSVLQDALTWALEQALAHREPAPEQIARRVYRGQPQAGVDGNQVEPKKAQKTKASPTAAPGFARVYRGRSVK